MERSLQDYENTITLINHLISTSYILIKYVVGPVLWFVLEMADRRRQKKRGCLGKFARITQPMQSIILLIFEKQLPIEQYTDDRDSNKVPKMTLYGKRLSYGAITVLFVIISTFWVLALGSGLNFSLLSMTHTCSEDWKIDCYPVLLGGANNTGLNITTSKPIQNCSFWKSEAVADHVLFICFQYVFDAERFLSVIGGLLALFIYGTKTTITFPRFLSVCCLGGHKAESNISKKRRRRCIYVSRIVISVIMSICEIVLEILGYIFGATVIRAHINEHTSNLVYFLAKYAIDILLVFGVLSTLLWLPWEEYATDYEGENHSADTPDVELQYTQLVESGTPQESDNQQESGNQLKSGSLLETALKSGDQLKTGGQPETAALSETET